MMMRHISFQQSTGLVWSTTANVAAAKDAAGPKLSLTITQKALRMSVTMSIQSLLLLTEYECLRVLQKDAVSRSFNACFHVLECSSQLNARMHAAYMIVT